MPRLASAHRLSGFALGLDLRRVPAPVIERACLHILDALGVALAATGYDFAERGRAATVALAGQGDSPVIGWPDRLPMRDAAWLNGLLIHGLDYDDTHGASVVHASASALPAVLAAGLACGASGGQAVAAYLVAMEADARIGSVDGRFQKQGFHPTGVVGTFGATLAAGRLLGLDFVALNHAQGIALSMASGSMQFLEDGAWTKRMHPGGAAAAALQATALARGGFTGPAQPYEGRYGLYRSYLGYDGGDALAERLESLGEEWEMLRVGVKPYPVCHFNHAPIDAALALRAGHGLTAGDIARITVRLHPDQMPVVCEPADAKRQPRGDYEAKFSVQFAVAVALVRGRLTLDELEPDALADETVLALAARCEHAADPASEYPRVFPAEVVIETRDGRRLSHREAVNRGAEGRPLSAAEIIAKFEDNAARIMPDQAVDELRERTLNLPALDSLAELAEAFTAEP
ncbi:MAG: MmgE/PrpD family protein [Gammaproteobacteria bacterium]|nr:MmgE/PrpD family protein [Gammaproteobacteria bacterium]TVQ47398.1 MAG: MmgE/PrpD family protein [Gammaproteobacteria bacterium]